MTPNTPRRGRYLVKNRWLYAWLRVRDALERLTLDASSSKGSGAPERVLVCVGGHLGDAVIATGVLVEVARRAPGAEIGVLCASWQRMVFEGHPLARRVHVRDHWRLNRGASSPIAKLRTSRATRTSAVREIRAAGYDLAIDLSSHWPNASDVLRAAGVPVRVGYESGGGGPSYTSALAWTSRGHVFGEHEALVDAALPASESGRGISYAPAAADAGTSHRVTELLASLGAQGSFAIIHAGAGDVAKEWPIQEWATVARAIRTAGLSVVATGAGEHEVSLAKQLHGLVPEVVVAADRLSWSEFHSAVSLASLVASVDTVAAHLAAACGTPSVTLATGADDPARWRPLGPHVRLLLPDQRGRITATAVVEAISAALAHMTKRTAQPAAGG